MRQVVESAGRSLVVLSGGSKVDDDALLADALHHGGGGSGVIYGRNVWQREWSEANEVIDQIKEILRLERLADALGPASDPAPHFGAGRSHPGHVRTAAAGETGPPCSAPASRASARWPCWRS